MNKSNSIANKVNPLWGAFIFLFLFVLILFSIYKIIVLASPAKTVDLVKKIENSSKVKMLNSEIYSTKPLDYRSVYKNYPLLGISDKFTIPTNMPISQKTLTAKQDNILRLRLMDLKYQYIIKQLTSDLISPQKSIILNVWFWFWSAIFWFSTILCNKFANRSADFLIEKIW